MIQLRFFFPVGLRWGGVEVGVLSKFKDRFKPINIFKYLVINRGPPIFIYIDVS